jgi:hypothetical protein
MAMALAQCLADWPGKPEPSDLRPAILDAAPSGERKRARHELHFAASMHLSSFETDQLGQMIPGSINAALHGTDRTSKGLRGFFIG